MDVEQILRHAGEALVHVLAVGLVLGAGLPALFAAGVRSLNAGHLGLARLCFVVCSVGVVTGIVVIVWGKQLFG